MFWDEKLKKRMKGLIFYKAKNGTSTMKNHYEVEHLNIF
jgi:hypothetical protein